MEKRALIGAVGNIIDAATMENRMEVSHKIKNQFNSVARCV